MEQKTLLKNKKNQGNGGETMAKRDDSVKKKVPELRFKGFTDDWEQRKLGEVVEGEIKGKAKANMQGNRSIYLETEYLNGGETTFVDSDADVEEDDILILWDGSQAGTVYHGFFGALGSTLKAYRPKESGKFVYYQLVAHQEMIFQRYRTPNIPHVIKTFTEEFSVFTTSLPEQERIGNFFKQLDNLITLHQRKLDLLKEQKKGFLQKMFPKNGEKVPELRFAGFADDWEEHKVGNFLSESKIKGSDGSVSKKLTVKLWRKGIVPKEEIYKGSSATQYYIRLAGQFMYGKLDFLNQAFGILPNELDGYESTLDSPAFDFKDGINPNFFLEYVCRENFYKYQGNIANGSRKAKRIHADTFFDMPITIPNFEEQQKIGSFFKQLDDTTALHQRKLDLLKEQKKGFLQKMFV